MDEIRLEQLRDFVSQACKQGATYDVIRQQLLGGGWSDDDVNEYLPTAWQQVEAATAAPAAPPTAMPASPPSQPPTAAAPPMAPPGAVAGETPAYTPPVVAPVTPPAEPVQPPYTPPVAPPVTTAPPAYPAPVQPTYAASPAYPPGYAGDNTSGNPQAPVPPEVETMGFCWGALGLTWIWGLGNKVYIALIGLIGCLQLPLGIYLGIVGHKMVWQNRRFDSLEQYKATMRVWNIWGIVFFILNIIGGIIYAIVVVGAEMAKSGGS